MNSLDAGFDRRLPLSHPLLRSVRLVGEYKGKEELFRSQIPQALETLRHAAIVQSTESSNRIEGVTAAPDRIREIVARKTTPRNRSEQEIAGYRDVLNTIHGNYEGMTLTPNLVRQLHRDLFKYSGARGGNWKSTPNTILERRPDGTEQVRFEPLPPERVPDAMEDLHRELKRRWQEDTVDKILLIPTYVFDFLCIHPFTDGNGRMSRLLTLLLLYQAGYEVGRYISIEKIVEDSKESYYDTLNQSSQGWHEGTHTLEPWTEYFLGVLLAAYKEFEDRVGMLTVARGAKTAMVRDAIQRFHGDFSVAQVQEQCPSVGIDLIRRILRQGRKARRLVCLGRGPQARWRRK